VSAPAALSHPEALAALDAAYDLLVAVGRRALAEQATDTDGSARPLGAGAETQGGLSDRVPKNEETALLPEDGFDGNAPSANEEAFHA